MAVITTELVPKVRANITIAWTVKETSPAKLRILVKRILRQYSYLPYLTDKAIQLILEQAELLAAD